MGTPTLMLDFARTRRLDPRITFTRSSTATYFDSTGTLKTAAVNEARFDHDPSTLESKGLLIEESRTNYVRYNRDLTQVARWTATNVTVAKDATGIDWVTNSACTLTATSTNGTVLQTIPGSTGSATRISSAYVKRKTGSGTVELTQDNGATWTTITVTSAWTRVELASATVASPVVGFRIATSADAIYVDFVQHETASFSTSAIEVSADSDVTRSADVASMTGTNFSSWYNQTEGTVVTKIHDNLTSTSRSVFSMHDGSTANRIMTSFGSGNALDDAIVASSSDTFTGLNTTLTSSTNTIALGYKGNDSSDALNGTVLGTPDTTVTVPSGLITLTIGDRNGSSKLNGHIARLAYFNTRLTNSELKELSATSAAGDVPTLQLNFAQSKFLDPRITFTRSSTGTYYDSTGTLKTAATNEGRFDHDPSTLESKGLLIEESRTNYIVDTAFSTVATSPGNDTWVDAFTEVDTTVNSAVAPDGTTTAILVAVNTTTTYKYIYQRTAETTATTYTLSFYAKPASSDLVLSAALAGEATATNYIRCSFTMSGSGTAAVLNTIGTAVSASSPTMQQLSNGWYRCMMYVTLAAPTNVTVLLYPGLSSAQTSSSQTYLWGAQLEVGSFATSYISNPAATSGATRSADVASMTGTNFSSWYNQTEGTFVANAAQRATQSTNGRVVNVSDGTISNRIEMFYPSSSSTTASLYTEVSGVAQVNSVYTIANNTTLTSIAAGYRANDYSMACGGILGTVDTSATVPTVSQMRIGYSTSPGNLNGHIARLTYYPKRLGNTTLQALSGA